MKKVSLLASSSWTESARVGTVVKPHGVRGLVVVHAETDNPDRFTPGARFFASDGRTLEVEWVQGGGVADGSSFLVQFQGIEGRDSADELRGIALSIPVSERRGLSEGEYWPDELVGLEVRDPGGARLGKVVEVIDTAAQVRLSIELVTTETVEVPFVAALVPEVAVDEGYLVVDPVDGLV